MFRGGDSAIDSSVSTLYTLAWLLAALLLIVLNGFFVAAEFAIVRVRATRIEQLAAEGNARARVVKRVLEDLDGHLSAVQLGITLASLALGWIGEPALAHLMERPFRLLARWAPVLDTPAAVHTAAVAVAFAIITMLHIVLGELAPKSLAIIKTERMTLLTGPLLHRFYWLFRPAIRLLNGMSGLLLRAVGITAPELHEVAHTDEELRMLVSASAKGGYLDEAEREMLDNVFDFSERVAREIMVPRNDMVCLYVEDPIEQSLKVAKEEGHTRFPLCFEEKDNVLGLIHIKDLFAKQGECTDLRQIMRPIMMVPENISVSKLLKEFQRQRAQMAILVDEYGGTAGLVTIEDVLEELVGEIRDEFDEPEEPEVEKVAPDTYEVDGALLLEEATEQFGLELPEEEPDVDTVGGYVFTMLGRQPEPGDRVELGQFTAEVAETEGFRITRLRLTRRRPENGGEGQAEGEAPERGAVAASPPKEAG